MGATEKALAAAEVEVVAKATRRRFTVEYKRKILREAEACKRRGRWGHSCAGVNRTRFRWTPV